MSIIYNKSNEVFLALCESSKKYLIKLDMTPDQKPYNLHHAVFFHSDKKIPNLLYSSTPFKYIFFNNISYEYEKIIYIGASRSDYIIVHLRDGRITIDNKITALIPTTPLYGTYKKKFFACGDKIYNMLHDATIEHVPNNFIHEPYKILLVLSKNEGIVQYNNKIYKYKEYLLIEQEYIIVNDIIIINYNDECSLIIDIVNMYSILYIVKYTRFVSSLESIEINGNNDMMYVSNGKTYLGYYGEISDEYSLLPHLVQTKSARKI